MKLAHWFLTALTILVGGVHTLRSQGTDQQLYTDSLLTPWTNMSYGGTVTLQSAEQALTGTKSIKTAANGWGVLKLRSGTSGSEIDIDSADYTHLQFALYSTSPSLYLRVFVETKYAVASPGYYLDDIPVDQWLMITLPMDYINPDSLIFHRIGLLNYSGTVHTFYVDEMRLIGHPATDTIPPTPTLLTLATSATSVPRRPTLSWYSSTGASSYHLQVSTSSGFGTTVVDDSTITLTHRYLSSSLDVSADYYWRVRAKNDSGVSDFSAARQFTTLPINTADNDIYHDTLIAPWTTLPTWSTTLEIKDTTHIYDGSYSIKVNNSAWGGIVFRSGDWSTVEDVDPTDYVSLDFALYTSDSLVLSIYVRNDDSGTSSGIVYNSILKNQWVLFSVPMDSMNRKGYDIHDIKIQNYTATSKLYYLDEVRLVAHQAAAPTLVSPADSADDVPAMPTLVWNAYDDTTTSYHLQVASNLGFTSLRVNDSTLVDTSRTIVTLTNDSTYYWRVRATSGGETSSWSDVWQFSTVGDTVPAIVASSVDPTVSTLLFESNTFLYSGPNKVQFDLDTAKLDLLRFSTVRGKVLEGDTIALEGVRVTVINHPELGYTFSRSDGMYDMVVNGGGDLTLDFKKDGYLPCQRIASAGWQKYGLVEDLVMVQRDTVVHHIDFSTSIGVQGSETDDDAGTRRPVVFFEDSTDASLVFKVDSTRTIPGCTGVPSNVITVQKDSIVSIDRLSFRVQEYSIGSEGEKRLPAPLPPTVAYSFAFELQADEVITEGANHAELSKAATLLLENVLEYPNGMDIPLGYYDRTQAAWLPTDNGKVIKIVSLDSGYASIDFDGDNTAENPDSLVVYGISLQEQQFLAAQYASSQSLLRLEFSKLGSFAVGFGFFLPEGIPGPSNPAPDRFAEVDRDNTMEGSIISVQNQVLGESVPVVNTGTSLHYRSDRVEGRREAYTLDIPLTGSSELDTSLKRVELRIEVAGTVIEESYEPDSNLSYKFEWDGKDVYGRKMLGQQNILTQISYFFSTQHAIPSDHGRSFNTPTGQSMITYIPTRKEMAKIQVWEGKIGAFDIVSLGVSGWSLSAHHGYDVLGKILYTGDGQVRNARVMDNVITTVAGASFTTSYPVCDSTLLGVGGPATQAKLTFTTSLRFGPDGLLYMGDQNGRIWKIDDEGIFRSVAGFLYTCSSPLSLFGDGYVANCATIIDATGLAFKPGGELYLSDHQHHAVRVIHPDGDIQRAAGIYSSGGFSGDGGPDTSAQFQLPNDLRFSSDGSLIIADQNNHRVRKIRPDRTVVTIAGGGAVLGDNGPAIQAKLNFPRGVALGKDGSVYIADYSNHRVRKVSPDGIISTVAGNGTSGSVGDGGLSSAARISFPEDVAFGSDGTLYFSDYGNGRIRAVSMDGYIKTVAGGGNYLRSEAESGPATAALLLPSAMDVGPDGNLYIADRHSSGGQDPRVVKIAPPLTGLTLSEILIASEDGSEQYVFGLSGRHLRTLDALTGVVKYTFNYDGLYRLTSIVDVDSLITTIERDSTGTVTGIISPYGVRTDLELDSLHHLLRVVNPASDTVQFSYTSLGLMTSMTDAKGAVHSFEYDALGLGYLTRDEDPVGGFTQISRVYDSTGYTITATTAEGKVSTYRVDQLRNGTRELLNTDANGLETTTADNTSGIDTTTAPSGMEVPVQQKPDPRYGMQSPLGNLTVNAPSGLSSNVNQFRKITEMSGQSVTGLTDSVLVNGKVFKTQWDGNERKLTRISPEGRETFLFYNERNKIVKDSTAGLRAVKYQYDSLGRRTTKNHGGRITTYVYDQFGRDSVVTDPLGRRTQYFFDPADRLTGVVAPDSTQVLFEYDKNGNVTGMSPPGRPVHVFEYSDVNLETAYFPPFAGDSARATTRMYSLDKELAHVARPDSLYIALNYGGSGSLAGHPKTFEFDRGTIVVLYDTVNSVILGAVSPELDTLSYFYDGSILRRIVWSGLNGASSVKGEIQYGYNSDLQVTSEVISTPATQADTVVMSYDDDGLIDRAGIMRFVYDTGVGLLTSDTVESVITKYTYSLYGELSSKETSFDSTLLLRQTFVYDSLGKIIEIQECSQTDTLTHSYVYDERGRLSEVYRDDTLQSVYGYDLNGNRLVTTTAARSDSGTYDDQDRMRHYGGSDYFYTEYGDLSVRVSGSDTTEYRYDALGNLVLVSLSNGTLVEYLLDGMGLRVGRRVNGMITHKWLRPNLFSCIAELDSVDAVVARYIYTSNRSVPEYLVRNDTTYRIVSDHLGSPRMVVNTDNGHIVQEIRFDENGILVDDSNPGFISFGFAGGQYDLLTGLTRLGKRDFDAAVGRWTCKDPMGFRADAENLYVYAMNDPVGSVDPFGLMAANSASLAAANNHAAAAAASGPALASAWGSEILGLIFAQAVISLGTTYALHNAFASQAQNKDDEIASEKFGKYLHRLVGRELGPKYRDRLHKYFKRRGEQDRTVGELKEQARQLYREAGKPLPKVLY